MIFAVPSRSPDGHLANFVTIDLHAPSKTENASSKYSINHFPPFSVNAAGLFPYALLNMREKYSGSEKPHISAISFIDIWRPYISSSFFAYSMRSERRN